MNFSAIAEPELALLGDSATRILSMAPLSMAPFASSMLVAVSYIDGAGPRQCYLVYEADSGTYTSNLSDYLGGVDVVEITAVDVAWTAAAGVTYALAYIDRTESAYLLTSSGNRIAVVQDGQILHQDIIEKSSGEIANTGVDRVLINAQGTEVSFSSAANNLIDLDTNDLADVYRINLNDNSISRVSQVTEDDEGSEPSSLLGISTADTETRILFETAATEFSLSDTNEKNDLYLATLGAEAGVRLISGNKTGEASSVVVGQALLAGDSVVYVSESDELLDDDNNQSKDIFLQDIGSGAIQRLTAGLDAQLGSYNSVDYQLLDLDSSVSQLMFSSNYSTLSSDAGLYQIYLMDLETRAVEILSKTPKGDAGNDSSVVGIMDRVGSNYAYQTQATNLAEEPGTVLTTNIQPEVQLFDTAQRGLTNLTLDLWQEGESLNQGVSVDNSGLQIAEVVEFDEVRIEPPQAYQQDINISDAIDVLRHIVKLENFDDGTANYHAADVNNDGKIGISDAIAILRDIVNLETIDTFDLIDQQGARVTRMDAGVSGAPVEWTIVANGDVNLSGTFEEGYVLQSDIV